MKSSSKTPGAYSQRSTAHISHVLATVVVVSVLAPFARGQDDGQRAAAEINAPFMDPDVDDFVQRFEVESREVFEKRQVILKACQIKRGEVVADIGAGTGLFTRLFSEAVGPHGRVIAVDISQKFLDHIRKVSRELDQKNVDVLLCTQDSTELPPESINAAFICDTYHHFEHPRKTMQSILRALKPGGRVILVDYRRISGVSSEWTLNHVRAGQETFEQEIQEAGFEKVDELKEGLKENYLIVFEKKP